MYGCREMQLASWQLGEYRLDVFLTLKKRGNQNEAASLQSLLTCRL
jgi:hypothetical protein